MTRPIWPEMMDGARQRLALHIGRTALGLIAEHGLGGTTMSRLAKAAGVSRATLYKYFPDVEAAVVAYVAAEIERYQAELRAALSQVDDPCLRMDMYIDHQVDYLHGEEHRAGAGQLEAASLSPGAQAGLEAHLVSLRAIVAEILSAGVAAGVFRADLDVDVQTTLLLHLMNGAHSALDKDGVPPHRVKAALKDIVHRGLFARPPDRRTGRPVRSPS